MFNLFRRRIHGRGCWWRRLADNKSFMLSQNPYSRFITPGYRWNLGSSQLHGRCSCQECLLTHHSTDVSCPAAPLQDWTPQHSAPCIASHQGLRRTAGRRCRRCRACAYRTNRDQAYVSCVNPLRDGNVVIVWPVQDQSFRWTSLLPDSSHPLSQLFQLQPDSSHIESRGKQRCRKAAPNDRQQRWVKCCRGTLAFSQERQVQHDGLGVRN